MENLFQSSQRSVKMLTNGNMFVTELVKGDHTKEAEARQISDAPRKYKIKGTELSELGAILVNLCGRNYTLFWYVPSNAAEITLGTRIRTALASVGSGAEDFGKEAGSVVAAVESIASAAGSVGSMVQSLVKAAATVGGARTSVLGGAVAVGFIGSIMVGLFKGGKSVQRFGGFKGGRNK